MLCGKPKYFIKHVNNGGYRQTSYHSVWRDAVNAPQRLTYSSITSKTVLQNQHINLHMATSFQETIYDMAIAPDV